MIPLQSLLPAGLWEAQVVLVMMNPPASTGREVSSIPGSERSPGGEQSIPVSLPGEFCGQRSLEGYSPWVSKSQTWLKELSMHTHTRSPKWDLLKNQTVDPSQHTELWNMINGCPCKSLITERFAAQEQKTRVLLPVLSLSHSFMSASYYYFPSR